MRNQLININILNFIYFKKCTKIRKKKQKIMVKMISKEQIKIKKIV